MQIVSGGCRGAGLHRGGAPGWKFLLDSKMKMSGFAFSKRFFFNPISKGPLHTKPQKGVRRQMANTSEILAVKWSIMKVMNCKFEMNIFDFVSKIRVSRYMVQMPALTFSSEMGFLFSQIVSKRQNFNTAAKIAGILS